MTAFYPLTRPLLSLALLGSAAAAIAQPRPAGGGDKIKVYLVGTFHFSGSDSGFRPAQGYQNRHDNA